MTHTCTLHRYRRIRKCRVQTQTGAPPEQTLKQLEEAGEVQSKQKNQINAVTSITELENPIIQQI